MELAAVMSLPQRHQTPQRRVLVSPAIPAYRHPLFAASPDRFYENVWIAPVVVAELKFRDVQREIFRADFVERSDNAVLYQGPAAFDGSSNSSHAGLSRSLLYRFLKPPKRIRSARRHHARVRCQQPLRSGKRDQSGAQFIGAAFRDEAFISGQAVGRAGHGNKSSPECRFRGSSFVV